MFVLATRRGLDFAAQAGLPVVVGGPILDGSGARVPELDRYRDSFVPSAGNRSPYVIVSLEVMIAEDEDRARELLLPEAWALAQSSRTGEFPPLESVADIRGQAWTSRLREQVDASIANSIHGTAEQVRVALGALAARTGADELLASTSTFDRAALFESDRQLSLLDV